MKRITSRIAALVIGLGLGAVALAGLETVTHIQDLNASWPLGSDLASTSDDHIRNIKSALKTDFPNFNGTYNSASLPVFAIPNDTNTGMYGPSADTLGWTTGGTQRGSVSSTGGWNLNAPSTSTDTLTVNGPATLGSALVLNSAASSSALMGFKNNGTQRGFIGAAGSTDAVITGSSTGDLVFRGESTVNLLFSADAGSTVEMKIAGTPAIQGRGPVAAALVDMTPDQGSWTATFSGAISTTGTVKWRRIGNQAFIYIDANITATAGSATTITFNGVPAAITPAAARFAPTMIINNSLQAIGTATVNTNNTVTLWPGFGASANFTNGVSDGISASATIIYPL